MSQLGYTAMAGFFGLMRPIFMLDGAYLDLLHWKCGRGTESHKKKKVAEDGRLEA